MDDAIEELRTLRDLIRWGASRFNAAALTFGHGTDNALDEAAALVLHAVHLPPDTPDAYLDARLTRAERDAAAALLERRIRERKPAPYLTGEAWFAGLAFSVDERVIIPRSPIAELIERQLAPWVEAEAVRRILDMGTGSGCIAVACAYYFPEAQVDAVDASEGALEVARANVVAHGVEGRVRILRSDLFEAVRDGRYDLVIANPPYVDRSGMEGLPAEHRHEPATGLAGGEAGLDFALPVLRQAPGFMAPGGVLVLEVGHSAPALAARCPHVPFTWLELERGGAGVCLLDRERLVEHAEAFR
ncbi:MAG: 50S ribosomal protein L3 N(5)-glutamine methyltransferase [Gammaproteobacteria bacterium]|nr:50S ribosomal protein L3 N(5)-glutamine methyltransferase [Gammaproteobacteria bacterium]